MVGGWRHVNDELQYVCVSMRLQAHEGSCDAADHSAIYARFLAYEPRSITLPHSFDPFTVFKVPFVEQQAALFDAHFYDWWSKRWLRSYRRCGKVLNDWEPTWHGARQSLSTSISTIFLFHCEHSSRTSTLKQSGERSNDFNSEVNGSNAW